MKSISYAKTLFVKIPTHQPGYACSVRHARYRSWNSLFHVDAHSRQRLSASRSSGAASNTDIQSLPGGSGAGMPSKGLGEVYLVGTGPGDPELITLKAYRLMQEADVVLYDRLVSDEILDMIHPGALMVYVGKQVGYHTRTQEEIHDLLLKYAYEGQRVLRLKGGDPLIFGRGGEEQQYLAAKGIACHVIPGITAASGICAELGIPLTHRGVATGVRYITGHMRNGADVELQRSLAECGDPMTTMVFYMGLQTLPFLRNALYAVGVDNDLPAVAVERGTTPQQREVWAPLSALVENVHEAALKSPTLIIMGNVVSLGRGWSESTSTAKHMNSHLPMEELLAPPCLVSEESLAENGYDLRLP